MSYDNTNSGALFKNDRKETDNHPDYKGSINVGGVEYWINAWLNESKSGQKYMGLKIKAKDAAPVAPAPAPEASDAFGDDIPFN